MAEKVKRANGPYWSKAWIQEMWEFTNRNFVDFDTGAVDFTALGKEEYEFRKAMFFRNFKNSERAKEAFEEAKEVYDKHVSAGSTRGRNTNETQGAMEPSQGQKVWGKYENVFLTQKQHDELAQLLGNVDGINRMIESLSCNLQDGKTRSKDHEATLRKWIEYRKEHPEKRTMAERMDDEDERRAEMIRSLHK